MHKSSISLAVHMHDCYGVHMHETSKEPVQTGTSSTPPTKKVVGGITLYGPQLAKLAAAGPSRSAVIRKLIDEHL
jgi:hypothetical protein